MSTPSLLLSRIFFGLMFFVLSACAGTPATETTGKKEEANILILSELAKDSEDSINIWVLYISSLGKWADEHMDEMVNKDFEGEVFARSRACEQLAVFQAMNNWKSDPEWDEMQKVQLAGFMREYVWSFRHQTEWTDPGDLRLSEFEEWRKNNLPEKPLIKAPRAIIEH